jgi:hypothetical protein
MGHTGYYERHLREKEFGRDPYKYAWEVEREEMGMKKALERAVDPDVALNAELRNQGFDVAPVTRAPYVPGEDLLKAFKIIYGEPGHITAIVIASNMQVALRKFEVAFPGEDVYAACHEQGSVIV